MSNNNKSDNLTDVDTDILDEEAVQSQPKVQEQPKAEQQTTPEVDEVPEKYKGKSLKEVVQMHQELEKLNGKHSNELGELRKTIDQFIQTKNASAEKDEPTVDFDEDAYWSNPKDAIKSTIDKHPTVQEAKKLSEELKKEKALAQLQRSHPDHPEIVKDQAFQEWAGKSKVRLALLQKADKEYDAEAACELLDLWKERKDYVASKKAESEAKTKAAVKAASTGDVSASSEGSGKKFYSRRKINELMRANPKKYQALRADIARAYAEGRVRP